MIKYSDSLLLVWRVSDFEARNLSADFVEPQHLFLGLLKSVDLSLNVISKLLEIDTQKLAEIARDLADVRTTFEKCQINTTLVRRRLRKIAADHTHPKTTQKKLRRSSESRAIFKIAEVFSGASIVKPIHLLSILSETKIPSVLTVLADYQINTSTLINESTLIALAEVNNPNQNLSFSLSNLIDLVKSFGWHIEWNRFLVPGSIKWSFKISKAGISHIYQTENINEAITEISQQVFPK
jgi:hypothetical protein